MGVLFFLYGFISAVFQFILVKEFASSVAKNELYLIVAAFNWLAGASLGSFVSVKFDFKRKFFILFSYPLFLFSVVFVHLVKRLFLIPYYESVSVAAVAFFSLVAVFPAAFLWGAVFRILIRRFGEGSFKVFFYEAGGFFLGGLVYTFFLSEFFNPFFALFFISFIFPFLIEKNGGSLLYMVFFAVLTALFALSFGNVLDAEFFPLKIERGYGTHYGNVVEAELDGAKNILVNGSLVFSGGDKSYAEEFVSEIMSVKKGAQDVLFLSSYFKPYVGEFEKYEGVSVDFVQLNEKLLPGSESAENIRFIIDDPRRYVEKCGKRYDIVVSDISGPGTLAFNRFYTKEFFASVKALLKDEGGFVCKIFSKPDILGPNISKYDSILYYTGKEAFKNCFMIPGDEAVFVFSDMPLTKELFLSNYESSGVKNVYFDYYRFKDKLDDFKLAYFKREVESCRKEVNTDYYPKLFIYRVFLDELRFFPSLKLDFKLYSYVVLALFAFAAVFIFAGKFFFGEASVILDEVAVFGFFSIISSNAALLINQVVCGSFYQNAGIVFGIFMAGVSAGVALYSKIGKKTGAGRLFLSWALFFLSLSAKGAFYGYGKLDSYIIAAVSGIMSGFSYGVNSYRLDKKISDVYTHIFAYDMGGAAIGVFFFTILAFPFLGLEGLFFALSLFALSCLLRPCR